MRMDSLSVLTPYSSRWVILFNMKQLVRIFNQGFNGFSALGFAGLCILGVIACAQAEVIDKIVAVVDGHIITASDIRQERDILMRLSEKPMDDEKSLVQQLIDNYLIETQISDFPGIDIIDADVDQELQKFAAGDGPPSKALREAVRLRLRTRKYFELRFAQFIHASDEEVSNYYKAVFVPEANKRGLNPVPPLEQVTDLVRNNVVQESLDHEINIWLETIRRRSIIEVFQ